MAGRPEIVVLCGSSRFPDEFRNAEFALTMQGRIVLSVGLPSERAARVEITREQKAMLDELHKRKIDLADRVYILNVGGYVGASTRSEIEYAMAQRKPIDWLEPGMTASDGQDSDPRD